MDYGDLDVESIPASAEELLELLERQVKWITSCLASPQDSWMPHLFVRTRFQRDQPDGGDILHALAVPFNSDAEKRGVMLQLGRKLYTDQAMPAAAALSSEAWRSTREPDAPHVQPKDDPNRTEGIIVMASSLGGKRSAFVSIPITRGSKNVIIPGEPGKPVTSGVHSPLLGFLWTGYFEGVRSHLRRF